MNNNTLPLFIFVCGGAVLFGIINAWKSKLLRGKNVPEDLMVVVIFSVAAATAFGMEFFWNGIPEIYADFWLPFAVAAILNIGIQYWNVRALKLEDASIVAPLASAMPMFVIIMSWVILREWPTFLGRIGITCIAFGAYILYLKGSRVALPTLLVRVLPVGWHAYVLFYGAPWLRIFSSKGARLALLTAYLGAISVNFDKLATLRSNPMIYTGGAFLVVSVFVYAWSVSSGRWQNLDTQHVRPLVVIGILTGVCAVLMNAGYFYGIVPYVGALKRTQIFWTILFSGMFLGEQNTALRMVGATIIFIGTVLMIF